MTRSPPTKRPIQSGLTWRLPPWTAKNAIVSTWGNQPRSVLNTSSKIQAIDIDHAFQELLEGPKSATKGLSGIPNELRGEVLLDQSQQLIYAAATNRHLLQLRQTDPQRPTCKIELVILDADSKRVLTSVDVTPPVFESARYGTTYQKFSGMTVSDDGRYAVLAMKNFSADGVSYLGSTQLINLESGVALQRIIGPPDKNPRNKRGGLFGAGVAHTGDLLMVSAPSTYRYVAGRQATASTFDGRGVVYLFRPESEKPYRQIWGDTKKLGYAYQSSDFGLLADCSDRWLVSSLKVEYKSGMPAVLVYDTATGRLRGEIHHREQQTDLRAMVVNGDYVLVLSRGGNGDYVTSYELPSGRKMAECKVDKTRGETYRQIASWGTKVAVISGEYVKTFDINTGERLATIELKGAAIKSSRTNRPAGQVVDLDAHGAVAWKNLLAFPGQPHLSGHSMWVLDLEKMSE